MRFPAVFCFFLFSVSSLAAVPSSEQGIPFDGKTGYALDAKSLGIDIRHFSVAAWVRVTEPAEVPDSMQMFVSMGKTNQDDFKLYLNNRTPGAVRMQVEFAKTSRPQVGDSYNMAKAPLPQAGLWTHYLGVYDGQTITIYMNGKKQAEQRVALRRERFDSPFITLGAIPAGQGFFLNGALEDICIWNRALNDTEVAQVVEGKVVETDLIACWTSESLQGGKLISTVGDVPAAVPFIIGGKLPTPPAMPSPVTLDGKPLEFFDPEKTDYVYYMPHNFVAPPEIVPAASAVVSYSDQQCEVMVKDANGNEKKYRIAFQKLPELDLFLCIGQSNMAGRGLMDQGKGDMEPIDGVYLFTPEGNWVPANNPLNRYSSVRKELSMQQIGPAYAFAKKLAAQTKRPVGLIVNAKGGTGIDSWLKGSADGFYEEGVRRATEAKPWGTFRAILWHQGEANSGQAATYPERLKKMVADLRAALGDSDLFFAAGELGRWRKQANGKEGNASFNEMIGGIASFLDHAACVSTVGLTPLHGDFRDPHFDRESQFTLGERYADAVLQAVYGQK